MITHLEASAKAINAAFARLPAADREVIDMLVSGTPRIRVAERFGLSLTALDMLLQEAHRSVVHHLRNP